MSTSKESAERNRQQVKCVGGTQCRLVDLGHSTTKHATDQKYGSNQGEWGGDVLEGNPP